MNIKRRHKILKAGKSPSLEAMKRTYNRATLNGGVTQDFSANVENIREISRKLGYNIIKPNLELRRNLMLFSENYSSSVYGSDGTAPIKTTGFTAPNGTNTAWKLSESNATSIYDLFQIKTTVANGVYTYSVYLKAGERNFANLLVTDAVLTFGANVNFDLTVGTVASSITTYGSPTNVSANISNEGNGWYRCSLTTQVGSTSTYVQTTLKNANTPYGGTYLGTLGYGLYSWGSQFEANTTATTYQPNPVYVSDTNVNFLYVPSSYGESKNFVQNPSLRNLVKFSEDLTNPLFGGNINLTISQTALTNPVNNGNVSKLVATVTAATHAISLLNLGLPAATRTVSLSFWAKPAGYNYMCIANNDANIGIDLVNGTFNTNGGYINLKSTVGVNGFYKYEVTLTTSRPDSFYLGVRDTSGSFFWSAAGDGVSGIYVVGVQLELGNIVTPYQRTTDGISDFTFTRATSATVTNKQGVIEDSCYNLLQRSEDYSNIYWGKQSITLLTTSNINAFNGIGSTYLIEDNTNNSHTLAAAVNTFDGTSYVSEIYCRKRNHSWIQLISANAGFGLNVWCNFNFDTGLFGNKGASGTYIATPLQNGWYKLTVIAVAIGSASTSAITVTPTNNTDTATRGPIYLGTNTQFLEVCGLQVTQGSTPRQYLRTTNRLNVPKLDYSRSLLKPSLLIEPQRTNLVLWSESLDNIAHTKVNTTVATNSTLAPNGTLTADSLLETTSNTSHYFDYTGLTLTLNIPYTRTVYLKSIGGRQWVALNFFGGVSGSLYTYFDIINGVLGTVPAGITATIQSVGNGWFRCCITRTFTSTQTAAFAVFITLADNSLSSYIGDISKGLYVWGQQIEQGSNATTYIPTTTATVTRNAETSYVDLWNNNMLNKDNFTLFVEGYLYNGASNNGSVYLGTSTSTFTSSTNAIGFYEGIRAIQRDANVQTVSGSTMANNNSYKFIIQRNGTTVKYFRNGVQDVTTQTIPVSDYRYLVVNDGGSTYSIDKIALFNRTLTDDECLIITDLSTTTNPLSSEITPGITRYQAGAVLAPNGFIYMIPYSATSSSSLMIKLNPTTDACTLVSKTNPDSISGRHMGGVLAPNGKIYCAPYNSTQMLRIDPSDDSMTYFGTVYPTTTNKWRHGVLAPNGIIYYSKFSDTTWLRFDPATETSSTLITAPISNIALTLAPDGYLYSGIFNLGTTIYKFDPTTETFSTITISTINKNSLRGCLCRDGLIHYYMVGTSYVVKFNPLTQATTIVDTGVVVPSESEYFFSKIGLNGCVYFMPYSNIATRPIEYNPITGKSKLYGITLSGNNKSWGSAMANGNIYSAPVSSSYPKIIKTSNIGTPNIMGADAVIPANLADLPTSKYNMYYNHI